MRKSIQLLLLIFIIETCTFWLYAQNKSEVELYVETGHLSTVNSIAFSSDNKFLGSISNESIKIWDRANWKELKQLSGHASRGTNVIFSPDSKILASGGSDINNRAEIKLWDVESGNEVLTLKAGSEFTNIVLFSPDGKILAGDADTGIKLWNSSTGEELKELQCGTREFMSAVFSADNRFFASSCAGDIINVWDVITGEKLNTLNGYSDAINSISFSSDGETISASSIDGTVKMWSLSTSREIKTLLSNYNSESYRTNATAFSSDGKLFASGVKENIAVWDILNGQKLKVFQGHKGRISSITISSNKKILASGDADGVIKLWDLQSLTELKTLDSKSSTNNKLTFSHDGKFLAGAYANQTVIIWSLTDSKNTKLIQTQIDTVEEMEFSPNGRMLAVQSKDGDVEIWNVENGTALKTLKAEIGGAIAFSSDSRFFASGGWNISLWNLESGEKIQTIKNAHNFSNFMLGSPIMFSSDNSTLIIINGENTDFWDIKSGKLIKSVKTDYGEAYSYTSSQQLLAQGNFKKEYRDYDGANIKVVGEIDVWNIPTGQKVLSFQDDSLFVSFVQLNEEGNTLAVGSWSKLQTLPDHSKSVFSEFEDNLEVAFLPIDIDYCQYVVRLWDIKTGLEIKYDQLPHWVNVNEQMSYFGIYAISSFNGKPIQSVMKKGRIELLNPITKEEIASLIFVNKSGWIVITPDGRFDTNESLDNIQGLHWNLSIEPLKAFPIETFVRQYYEPNLLQRVLKCYGENNCDKEFKPLPSIAEINRVQPKILIREIKPAKDSVDLVDITVEVESVTEDVGVSMTDRTQKEKKTSGVYDLRLFRDEQLVGVSAPKAELEKYIKEAPRLVEETRASKKLIDTAEDAAWREANDLEKVAEFKNGKATFTFKNIKLPADGREIVSFTTYAFNRDKVKSQTTEPLKFSIPKVVSAEKKKGKAVIISIGVNASENPAYDLRYAANDAREMQKIVGGNLMREKGNKYADVIQIPIISDYETKQTPAANAARKEIVRSVFSILAGKKIKEVLAGLEKIDSDLAKEFKNIPNIDQLDLIEPEDTLIITYSGHGYADRSGIFYLLPSDIGKNTTKLTTENLHRMISSDELSFWMQDITAAEMIMIIDACHSAAAVQGDGFKPGPMGSRGLGQFAYDKDMKILSATQADNVALEIGSLQQGLLSYALLQDGIKNSLADKDKNKELFSAEWLEYAEERVPLLYQDVKDGRRSVFIGGEFIKDLKSRSEIVDLDNNQKANINLQKPNLFDFKRRTAEKILVTLR